MEPHTESTAATEAVHAAMAGQRDQLLALVRRRTGSRVDAEEVLQVALQRALERASQLRDPARAAAWVGRVVRNVLFDELRRHREVVLPIDELELAAIEDDQLDCWCVLVQVERLKPEYAEILRRVVVEGVQVKEVASQLGMTANNAMVRLHRARTALKERLAEHCGSTSTRSCSDCGCPERGCCPHP